MKRWCAFLIVIALLMASTACTGPKPKDDVVVIALADDGVTVDAEDAVYTDHDIVYYEDGKDFTYGEGADADAHTAEEAAEHTVVHITKAGTYRVSGTLSKGQIAVDLGEDAEDDKTAVVTLILDGADITCTVAPAVIFYNVYECGDADNPTKEVNTAAAGANVVIADDSENTINGSYVARIYKPDSVVLSEDGTKVEDAKKLHKYDGAFYSRMSMNIDGETKSSGVLNIRAENEGLDSEMHLTINGGDIRIESGNDGINTNEDGVSVTTVNGGILTIRVTGETGEGDGIDSNGWLVINGGTVTAYACSDSADAGIDSDNGIHLNGGTVLATGSMLDRIEDGGQTYAVFSFSQRQTAALALKQNDKISAEWETRNTYSTLIYSSPDLKAGEYTLWSGETWLAWQGGVGGGFHPNGMQPPMGERPSFDGEQGFTPPEGFERPEGSERPDGFEPPEKPEGGERPHGGFGGFGEAPTGEASTVFTIKEGANTFGGIREAE